MIMVIVRSLVAHAVASAGRVTPAGSAVRTGRVVDLRAAIAATTEAPVTRAWSAVIESVCPRVAFAAMMAVAATPGFSVVVTGPVLQMEANAAATVAPAKRDLSV